MLALLNHGLRDFVCVATIFFLLCAELLEFLVKIYVNGCGGVELLGKPRVLRSFLRKRGEELCIFWIGVLI